MIQRILDRRHFGLRLIDRHPWLQARDTNESGMDGAILQQRKIILSKGRINIRLFPGPPSKFKAGGENSDNRVINSVQGQRSAQRLPASTEPILPEAVADDDYRIFATPVFLGRKFAAEPQIYTERTKKARRDLSSVKMLWSPGIGQVTAPPADSRYLLK